MIFHAAGDLFPSTSRPEGKWKQEFHEAPLMYTWLLLDAACQSLAQLDAEKNLRATDQSDDSGCGEKGKGREGWILQRGDRKQIREATKLWEERNSENHEAIKIMFCEKL